MESPSATSVSSAASGAAQWKRCGSCVFDPHMTCSGSPICLIAEGQWGWVQREE